MLFKEIYQQTPDSSLFITMVRDYGVKIADWFYLRFKNFELLYDEETFIDMWNALIIENHIELLKIKKIIEQQEMWAIGNIATSSSDMTSTNNSNATQSYQGFNVEGEFAKNTTDGTSTGNTTANSTAINHTDEFNKLISFDYSTLLDKIYSKFVVLFVLCYN